MGWLSALGGIAKLASKLFGFMLMRKAVQADVMKDQLDDLHLKNEVTKQINATSVVNKRKRLFKHVKRK
jgi:hypothetical protein|tara:strand:- start:1294 stop:1500 length:207 start_codon:yes stop_codon:yes gene_type:complete